MYVGLVIMYVGIGITNIEFTIVLIFIIILEMSYKKVLFSI